MVSHEIFRASQLNMFLSSAINKADAFLTVVIQVLCAGVCVELLSPRGHNGRHDKCTHINKIFSPLEIVLLLQNSELFKDSRD